MAASWLVKMRVCHITAVVPDDLFHAPTWKSFPMALQLSISRQVSKENPGIQESKLKIL